MKKKQKFKVKIYDEAHLVDRGGFTVTWVRVALAALIGCGLFVMIGVGIVWFTPVKKRLPGYMPPAQRAMTEEAYLRVDSMQELYRVHQAYLENLVKILDTDREPDLPDTLGLAMPLMPDSLMVSSEIEREFMRKMEEAGYIIAITEGYEGNEEE